jgi:hypothetical protein
MCGGIGFVVGEGASRLSEIRKGCAVVRIHSGVLRPNGNDGWNVECVWEGVCNDESSSSVRTTSNTQDYFNQGLLGPEFR